MTGNYADRGDWRNAAHGYKDQRDALHTQLEHTKHAAALTRALRAFLDGNWSHAYALPRLAAHALGIDEQRIALDITRDSISLRIKADGPGGELWDDYTAAREDARHRVLTSPAIVDQYAHQYCDCHNLNHHPAP